MDMEGAKGEIVELGCVGRDAHRDGFTFVREVQDTKVAGVAGEHGRCRDCEKEKKAQKFLHEKDGE